MLLLLELGVLVFVFELLMLLPVLAGLKERRIVDVPTPPDPVALLLLILFVLILLLLELVRFRVLLIMLVFAPVLLLLLFRAPNDEREVASMWCACS